MTSTNQICEIPSTVSSSSSSSSNSKYSTTERNCKTVPAALTHRLDVDDIYAHPSSPDNKPNLDILKQHLLLEGRLTEQAAIRIIETGKNKILFLFFIV